MNQDNQASRQTANSTKDAAKNEKDTYNRGGLIAFLFSMIFSLVFFAYLSFMHKGIDLREVPQEAMAPVAEQEADQEAAPFDVSQVEKPWVFTEEMAQYGNKVFQTNCAICHGQGGKGDGPAGQGLNPPPRNLIEGNWTQGGTPIDLYVTLQKGIPGTSMAPFQHLPKADRWAMVHFIRSITKNKPEINDAKLEEFAKTAE